MKNDKKKLPINDYQLIIDTPLGKMVAKASKNAVFALDFFPFHCEFDQQSPVFQEFSAFPSISQVAEMTNNPNNILLRLKTELDEYFAEKRKIFSIPVLLQGTDFQIKSWQILQQIPYGKTISYTEQAILVGNKKAVRAVANANSKNKIILLVPCHRVIGSNGALTGFASGLWRKERLIELEKGSVAHR